MATEAPGDSARGIATMLLATAVIAVSDTIVRFTTQTVPISQFMFVRGSLAALILAAVAISLTKWSEWRWLSRPIVVARALIEAASVVAYIVALQKLLLAEVTAIYLASPLLAAAMVSLSGSETVGLRRWLIMGIGFFGVLLIVDPRLSGFNAGALYAVLSAVFVALRDVVTRRMTVAVPSILVTLCTTSVVALSGLVLGPFEAPWHMPTVTEGWLMIAAAVAVSIGNFLAVAAFRSGAVAVVSLFRYASLPFAIIAGLIVWGEIPGRGKIVGAAIICVSGILLLLNERRRRLTSVKQG